LERDPAAAFRQVDSELLGGCRVVNKKDIGESAGVVGVRSHPQPVRGLAFAAGVAEKGDPLELTPAEGNGTVLLVVLDLHFFLREKQALLRRGMPAQI